MLRSQAPFLFAFVILCITMFVVLVLWRPCVKLQEAVCEEDAERRKQRRTTKKRKPKKKQKNNKEKKQLPGQRAQNPHWPGNFRPAKVARPGRENAAWAQPDTGNADSLTLSHSSKRIRALRGPGPGNFQPQKVARPTPENAARAPC